MERNATSAVHFRTKLLTAACQMQSALCIQDLGQLYHKPLRDSHGTVVLACVNNVKVSVRRTICTIQHSESHYLSQNDAITLRFLIFFLFRFSLN